MSAPPPTIDASAARQAQLSAAMKAAMASNTSSADKPRAASEATTSVIFGVRRAQSQPPALASAAAAVAAHKAMEVVSKAADILGGCARTLDPNASPQEVKVRLLRILGERLPESAAQKASGDRREIKVTRGTIAGSWYVQVYFLDGASGLTHVLDFTAIRDAKQDAALVARMQEKAGGPAAQIKKLRSNLMWMATITGCALAMIHVDHPEMESDPYQVGMHMMLLRESVFGLLTDEELALGCWRLMHMQPPDNNSDRWRVEAVFHSPHDSQSLRLAVSLSGPVTKDRFTIKIKGDINGREITLFEAMPAELVLVDSSRTWPDMWCKVANQLSAAGTR